jgi:transglutaminase-like putative cysteine protease
MTHDSKSRRRIPIPTAELLQAAGPALGIGLLLTPGAYWDRVRAGRSPFAQTLYARRRTLPRLSLDGRVLPRDEYLRPTAFCNSHAPEVIALADDLRRRAGGDWEYVEAIFDYVRTEIVHAVEPMSRRGVVATLESGCGLCIDKLNVFVALARAGRMPARFCAVGNVAPLELTTERPRLQVVNRYLADIEADSDWRLKKIGSALRRLLSQIDRAVSAGESFEMRYHPMAEVKIGAFWIPVDPGSDDAESAAAGLPLPRLGYDPVLLRGFKGSVIARSEAYPIGTSYWALRLLLCLLARGIIDHVNHHFAKVRAAGEQVLAEVGKDEYIRRMRRFYVPVPGATEAGLPRLV